MQRIYQMSFGLVNPRVEGEDIQIFLRGNLISGFNRGCVIIYLFMKVLR